MKIPKPPTTEPFKTIYFEEYNGARIWIEPDEALNGYRGFFCIIDHAPGNPRSEISTYGGDTMNEVLNHAYEVIDSDRRLSHENPRT